VEEESDATHFENKIIRAQNKKNNTNIPLRTKRGDKKPLDEEN